MIFIPGNVPSSKNSKRWTGKMLINSKTVMNYIKATKCQYEENRSKFIEMTAGLEYPVVVSFKFIRGSRHKFDYINPAQTVQDLMVKNEWIEDDNANFIIPRFEEFTYDKENPGVEIQVYGRKCNTIS
tara:strand:+ start:153 stop:536 length:384 start_codon:yes stop_codon:yes gene_type:complete